VGQWEARGEGEVEMDAQLPIFDFWSGAQNYSAPFTLAVHHGRKATGCHEEEGLLQRHPGLHWHNFPGVLLEQHSLGVYHQVGYIFRSLWSLLYTSLTGFTTQEFSCRLFDALSSSLV